MLRFDHSVPTKNRLTSLLRRVLVGAAAACGLAAAAGATQSSFSCDVVVVGAGGAGLSAALSAAEAGAHVLVIEKMPMLGGNTLLSASHMLSPPTNSRQAEEKLESLVQAKGGGTSDPALARMIIRHSAETLDWLSGMGADFIRFTPTVVGQPLPDQGIRPKGGRVIGKEIVKTLLHGAETLRVPIQTLSSVTGITLDAGGRISGVEVLNSQGRVWQVKAKAVLLATGGFAANEDMVMRHASLPETMQSTNSPGCTGDGIVMAQSLGAQTIDMDAVTVHPTTLPFSGLVIPLQTRVLGAILVNERGERFADELSPGLRSAIEKQPGGRAWMIFDQKILASMPVLSKYARNGYFLKGSTEEELARRIRVSPQKLFQQISIYRSYVRKRHDEDYGRKTLPSLLFSYPLYAVSVSPGIHNTPGGLRVDEQGRVLSAGGPIPGLYAAGEVTGGIFGRSRPEGMGLTGALVHGRLTGRAAAEWALGRTR